MVLQFKNFGELTAQSSSHIVFSIVHMDENEYHL